MKAYLATALTLGMFGLIWVVCSVFPVGNVLIMGDVFNVLLPMLTLPVMAGPFWRRLHGGFCDRYDRFIAAVFYANLGIEVQMVWRLWDRVAGTPSRWRDEVLVYSLILIAIGGVFQIIALDDDDDGMSHTPKIHTWIKLFAVITTTAVVGSVAIAWVVPA